MIIILAATWLWYFVASGDLDLVGALGTSNRGTLVQPPRQLDDHALTDIDGLEITFAELEPRWALLIPSKGAQCDAACENTLYTTRQIHTAMGKEFNRIRRLFISDMAAADVTLGVTELSDGRPAPAGLEQYLESEHRGLKALSVAGTDHGVLFPEFADNPGTWYLVDPKGWIMMSYTADISYKDVISDLKFLLKN
ncbi:MAG: SCO family protein [Halioglobus sp.]